MDTTSGSQPELTDTIAAIATPPGRGGIGIVRLSGPEAVRISAKLVRGPGGSGGPAALHAAARVVQVLDLTGSGLPNPAADAEAGAGADGGGPAGVIDEAVMTAFYGPRSYTGEDVVEIAAHGSPVILDTLLRGALAAGARLAGPGEFTQRAFLAGRLDLTQAEAVRDLIAAQTLEQARTAAQQLGGALSRRVRPAKEVLLHLIALLEAGMDFATGELDDVDVVSPGHIAAQVAALREGLIALAASFQQGKLRREGAAIALVGPPNAGKSSLFNRLLTRERAIVTPQPGTTRDTVEEPLAIGGIPLRLIDTAGLRAASSEPQTLDEAEQQGIARSREALADADVVLLIHDATQPLHAEESALAAELSSRPHIRVFNKSDLLARPPEVRMGGEDLAAPLFTSAVTGAGLEALGAAILGALGAQGSPGESGALNTLRQHEAVTAALRSLDAAAAANAGSLPHEVLLMDLHAALRALDTLTGTTTTEDVLGRIFATFCIGK